MEIEREELIQALEVVEAGLASTEVIQQGASFIFHDKRLFAFNDVVAISAPSPLDIEGAVQGRELITFLKKMKNKTVDISVDEKQLMIEAGKTKAGIRLQEEILLPITTIKPKGGWNELPKNFVNAMTFTQFSIGKNDHRPLLTCLHVKDDFAESTDGFRATRYTLSEKIDDEFLIPYGAVKDVITFKPTHYNLTPGWVHFHNEEEILFSCRTFPDPSEFPDTNRIFDLEGPAIELPEKLGDILERAAIFTMEKDGHKSVDIQIEDGWIKARGEGDRGWSEEETRVRYKGGLIHIKINPQFLLQAFSKLNNMVVGENSVELIGDSFRHVIMLMATDTNSPRTER